MNPGTTTAFIMGAITMAWMFAPLFLKETGQKEDEAAVSGELHELRSRKEMLLAALKDLEDDYSTSKICDEDYGPLKHQLTGEAIEIMKRLDRMEGRNATERS